MDSWTNLADLGLKLLLHIYISDIRCQNGVTSKFRFVPINCGFNPNKGDPGVKHQAFSFYVLLLNFALVKILKFFDFS